MVREFAPLLVVFLVRDLLGTLQEQSPECTRLMRECALKIVRGGGPNSGARTLIQNTTRLAKSEKKKNEEH